MFYFLGSVLFEQEVICQHCMHEMTSHLLNANTWFFHDMVYRNTLPPCIANEEDTLINLRYLFTSGPAILFLQKKIGGLTNLRLN